MTHEPPSGTAKPRDLFSPILELFSDKNVAVVVVSFGAIQGARNWLEQTECGFPMFLDPERKLYKAFGLHRSLAKARTNIGF